MKNKEQYKTAVILCGGRGTRLGLLGKKLPKTLIKVHKKPIIWYIIKILKNKQKLVNNGYQKTKVMFNKSRILIQIKLIVRIL